MTVVWVTLGVFVVVGAGAFAYVRLRDRRRRSSGDESAATRLAAAEAQQDAAQRHAVQGGNWDRGRLGSP